MNAIGAWTNLNNDNIAKIIPEGPLNNIIPLMVDHGGGVAWGHFVGPWTRRRHATLSHKIQYIHECNGYKIWIVNKHFRNSEHHLLSSMSSGEHPLRVGT